VAEGEIQTSLTSIATSLTSILLVKSGRRTGQGMAGCMRTLQGRHGTASPALTWAHACTRQALLYVVASPPPVALARPSMPEDGRLKMRGSTYFVDRRPLFPFVGCVTRTWRKATQGPSQGCGIARFYVSFLSQRYRLNEPGYKLRILMLEHCTRFDVLWYNVLDL
jgi:hypothetical protein